MSAQTRFVKGKCPISCENPTRLVILPCGVCLLFGCAVPNLAHHVLGQGGRGGGLLLAYSVRISAFSRPIFLCIAKAGINSAPAVTTLIIA